MPSEMSPILTYPMIDGSFFNVGAGRVVEEALGVASALLETINTGVMRFFPDFEFDVFCLFKTLLSAKGTLEPVRMPPENAEDCNPIVASCGLKTGCPSGASGCRIANRSFSDSAESLFDCSSFSCAVLSLMSELEMPASPYNFRSNSF